jgi:hypothetical protein
VNANPVTAANANGASFQVQAISINFVGVQETVNLGAPNGGGQGSGTNSQTAIANLQIEQVQFTLVNGNGQTAQVQAPQQSTNTGTPNQQSPPPHTLAT